MQYDDQTADVYLEVFKDAPSRTLEAGETLIHAGEKARHVFTVLDGCMMVSRLGKDGRRQVMSFVFKDHFVGLTATENYFFTVQAITPSTVLWRTREHLESHLAGNQQAERTFREMVFRVLENSLDLVYSLGQRTAVERLAVFILYMRRQYHLSSEGSAGSNDIVELPMSRQDIADFLGLKKETVSRSFTALDDKGLISRPNTHSVEIGNLEALRELAGITDFSSPARLISPR